MNPPVEAPTSSASRSAYVEIENVQRVIEFFAAAADETARSLDLDPAHPARRSGRPSSRRRRRRVTRPSMMRLRACERVMPSRSATAASSRILMCGDHSREPAGTRSNERL